MTKIVTHIPVPSEWESTNDWDSHRPLLWLALNNTDGDVLEYGMGYGSTPLIDKICYEQNRHFESIETNEEWYEEIYKSLKDNLHGDLYLSLDDYSDEEISYCGLLFLDCAPASERKIVLGNNSHKCSAIVVHDTEVGSDYVYDMKEVLSTFRYRLDYEPIGKPRTTVVSNLLDVTKWI